MTSRTRGFSGASASRSNGVRRSAAWMASRVCGCAVTASRNSGERVRDQAAVLHVDLDRDTHGLRPVEDPVQVRHAGIPVHGLAQLGQLDGDRGVQTAGGDRLRRVLVLGDRMRRAGQIGDPLTEQVEDAADARELSSAAA